MHHNMKPSGLTLPGPLIRLWTPTQDLVFATERSRVTRSGGDFRDLTVFRAAGTGQARGSVERRLERFGRHSLQSVGQGVESIRSAADYMNTVVKIGPKDVDAIPFQEASLDIWDKKYRLTAKDGAPIDRTMDDTYQRVARALADVEHEEVREHWNERFLWALRRGAIPAGRIISNAGALEHKPATSTINCTVSGTIHDSMDDILRKVHEAGLTLKAGCVAPGTWVRTEKGLVTADQAVYEKHKEILCYDREAHQFEMRPILAHMTTHVAPDENIRITSNGVTR